MRTKPISEQATKKANRERGYRKADKPFKSKRCSKLMNYKQQKREALATEQ